ncbi:hypothetical protein Tco_1232425, partial [Tanacetum coccineum]
MIISRLGARRKLIEPNQEQRDFDVSVVRLQTCLIDILGFLEKFKGGFEQDIDDEGEEDKEDEEEKDAKDGLAKEGSSLK